MELRVLVHFRPTAHFGRVAMATVMYYHSGVKVSAQINTVPNVWVTRMKVKSTDD